MIAAGLPRIESRDRLAKLIPPCQSSNPVRAWALTGGQINLVTIVIGSELSGDILADPGLGSALAFGMVVIMALAIIIRTVLQRQTERWLR